MSYLIIGVDTGTSGAVAGLEMSPTGSELSVVFVEDLPDLMDPRDSDFISRCAEQPGSWGFIEKLTGPPPPPCGRLAAWKLGYSYGAWRCGLALAVHNYREVLARDWRGEIYRGEAKVKGDKAKKNQSLGMARRLFPDAAEELRRVKDHNRAEALLIAEYGRRLVLGGQRA